MRLLLLERSVIAAKCLKGRVTRMNVKQCMREATWACCTVCYFSLVSHATDPVGQQSQPFVNPQPEGDAAVAAASPSGATMATPVNGSKCIIKPEGWSNICA